jgi:type IV pilus assembly protein PilA
MQKLQQGFTLIELMIVVAIIGILAALAVPAYQDYTIRSKVSEAASLASAARTAVDVYYSETGTLSLPAQGGAVNDRHVSLGLSLPTSYTAKYVNKVEVADDGVITVTLQDLNELGQASAKTVIYTPRNNEGNLEWVVSGGTVPAKYEPRR